MAALQACRQARSTTQQQGGDAHRAEHRREQQAGQIAVEQLATLHLGQQGKEELAALRQGQAAAPGDGCGIAAQAHQQGHDQPLDGDQQQRQGNNGQAMAEEQAQVDEHADADEKQAQQHVAKWTDVGFDLMAIVAFPEQHAGEKGAQCHGQAKQVGQPGRQQYDDQGHEQEQFIGACCRHFMKQARQQPATGHQQADEQQHGFAQGQRQRHVPGLLGTAADQWQQGQQQYRDQILEEQYANGVLSVGGKNLPQAAQLLADDGRGG